jgi:hypothetical protein
MRRRVLTSSMTNKLGTKRDGKGGHTNYLSLPRRLATQFHLLPKFNSLFIEIYLPRFFTDIEHI